MQVKSIAECSKGSILQYFQPPLSYHLSLRFLFCLILSGHFTQVLLFTLVTNLCLKAGEFFSYNNVEYEYSHNYSVVFKNPKIRVLKIAKQKHI